MDVAEIKLTQYSKGGGCGCKIAPSVLQQILQTDQQLPFENLLVGNESSDDAAVYQFNEHQAVISTADFFLPIVDSPFDFGRIAAANAISDVYAMGGTPTMAIALLGWPIERLPAEAAKQVLAGARAVCVNANIPLAGGHTIDSSDPIFGLAVTGLVETEQIKKNNTAKEGDLIFLTKPIGVGLLATALKRGLLQQEHYPAFIAQLTQLNSIGEQLASYVGVHAVTDVTGFGLLGHLIEMADGSDLSAELNYSAIQKTNGVDEYLKQKTIPDATFRNWNSYSSKVQFGQGVNVMEAFNLLPDPQTNGGLLIAVDEQTAPDLQQMLSTADMGSHCTPVGRFIGRADKSVYVI